ncbi:hypothetical protein AB4Z51_33325 [Bradyrhizobium sp. 2TAF36]|uniref:hypothetical protein n=1 Tax=Bradyrhizobium sp. 2TAF36 TaxID=3233016 RepID=UPI003F911506
MEQEFYQGLAHRVRTLAEKAEPFTRRRLLDLGCRALTRKPRWRQTGVESCRSGLAEFFPTPARQSTAITPRSLC